MVEKLQTKITIKAIIFDLNDVVIIDSHWEAMTNAAVRKDEDRKDFHYRVHSKNNIRNIIWWKFMTGRIDEKTYWKELDKNVKNLRVLVMMKKHVYSLLIPKKRTIELIKKLKPNYKVGLITNFSKEWMRLFRSSREGDETIKLFDEVINSGDVGLKKPDKRIYKIMIKRLGINPEEVVFVDDSEKNLITAKEVGLKTVLYQSVGRTKKELKNLGVKI